MPVQRAMVAIVGRCIDGVSHFRSSGKVGNRDVSPDEDVDFVVPKNARSISKQSAENERAAFVLNQQGEASGTYRYGVNG